MSADEFSITVPEASAGTRLDAFLAARLTDVSRAAIQRAVELGQVVVNERPAKSSYKVRAGDEVQVELPEAAPLTAAPEAIPLNIMYEDDEVIVVNKPAGMVVHPGAGIPAGTLANALVHHFGAQLSRELAQRQGALRPGIVHRLDVGTSGLIVVAKTDRAHASLAEQFESRAVLKGYTALVYGRVATETGRVDVPIGRDPHNRVKMAVRPTGQGRAALTLFRVAERFDEFTLLDVEIKTGRTHQIRVHLAHLKHPIVADSTYDSGRANTVKSPRVRTAIAHLNRPFLHAARLSFKHPASGIQMNFSAPLPDELENLLNLLRGGKG